MFQFKNKKGYKKRSHQVCVFPQEKKVKFSDKSFGN